MRIAVFLLVAVAPTTSLCASALEDNLYGLPEYLGQVNAWRLIPSVLLARCSKEAPEQEPERQASFRAWNTANKKLVSSIKRVVEMTATQFSSSTGQSAAKAKDQINAATTTLIQKNYFQDSSITVAQVCAGYSKIVVGLSSPGKVAATRGYVYAVEGLLAARQSSEGKANQAHQHAQPAIPPDLSRQAAPVR
ncbi:MAG: hypothetical protein LBQ32_07035 [Burkholderiaceae bacterium]|jgi:hypothetical protein|nr:hypothetical protein [Burkholderiaceae bacterium]